MTMYISVSIVPCNDTSVTRMLLRAARKGAKMPPPERACFRACWWLARSALVMAERPVIAKLFH